MRYLSKYLLLFTATFLFTGFFKAKEITEEEKIYQKVIEVEGSQLELYNKSLEWQNRAPLICRMCNLKRLFS